MSLRGKAVGVLACALFALAPPAAQAREVVVRSFDKTPIVVNFCPDDRSGKAPTVMIGPGWSGSGEDCGPGVGSGGAHGAHLTERGYNVVTWDPRGFGESGGAASVDDPGLEGRDAQAIVDYIADQPEARLDEPGDPVLGMAGGSYGGGIQLALAAFDDRVDAITPTIAWNNLSSSLFPQGGMRLGWGLLLTVGGVQGSTIPGVYSSAGVQTGTLHPRIVTAVAEAAASGSALQQNRKWFSEKGPDQFLHRVNVPTLIFQGTVDTLFTLDQGTRNFKRLRKLNPAPVKMNWFCGGHGTCLTETGPKGHTRKRQVRWFERHLKGRKVHTGPRFEWIDEDGGWHRERRFPPRRTGKLTAAGSGSLPFIPAVPAHVESLLAGGAFPLTVATPTASAIEIPVPGLTGRDALVAGAPRLKLTYSGSATPLQTYLYAQLVDTARDIVVNNRSTIIPIRLDGRTRTKTVRMERIASRLPRGGSYKLQIAGGSGIYDVQRAAGSVDVEARIKIPASATRAVPTLD